MVVLLFGYDLFPDQVAPAISCDLRDFVTSLRLCELLIDLRRFDLSEQLALFDVVADIGLLAFHVAIGPRIDRRLLECLESSWQN